MKAIFARSCKGQKKKIPKGECDIYCAFRELRRREISQPPNPIPSCSCTEFCDVEPEAVNMTIKREDLH